MGIVLLVLGMAGVVWGAFLGLNLRGATDKAAARRNAARAVAAAQTMDLGLTEPSRLGTWFFRLMGGIALLGGLFLGFVGLALTLAG
ncbi:hypothetical protein [Streptomyces montanisoli]|uniref:Uncharacterized protein n=1 Tax=Streptomyces montanisoli TaxID=2798581 RepID=A0A940RWV2_9ACTN|nr:hypothetical protein [Streptomyces montanisoli]MBP0457493.1 hypothetical protein [Streptomyces montanisoli]